MIGMGIISKESIKAYRKQFTDSACGYSIPNGCLRVDDLKNGRTYIAPDNETEELFLDRLERSKKEGRNLFLLNGMSRSIRKACGNDEDYYRYFSLTHHG